MGLHEALDDGEAQPGAAAPPVRLLVGIEDARQIARGNAGARVLDRDLEPVSDVRQPHRERAALGRELDGIAHEIDHDAKEPVLVPLHVEVDPARRPPDDQPALLRLQPQLVERPVHDLLHVHPTPLQRIEMAQAWATQKR